ncbi:MAG: hypothetical protein ACE5GJ_04710 [Gemmatimonadota bacterium]
MVADAVGPLSVEVPTAVAFGMADPRTLSESLDSLRVQGVRRVAVVRLFLSGRSFYDQTRYLLGLSESSPESFVLMGPPTHSGTIPLPIDHGMSVATHTDGLLVSDEARTIVAERARGLARNPERESVLLLAHGMGREDDNEEVVAALQTMADVLAESGFAEVEVATLREDWADKRKAAEESIRAFAAYQASTGRRLIVIPVRLYGFGPYAETLAGLEYSAGEGLLPHEAVLDWILATASDVFCRAGWGSAIAPCRP